LKHSLYSLQAFTGMNKELGASCPCGSTKAFKDCCEGFISGIKLPQTAEELMRSRYTAYGLKDIDYILDTHDPETRLDSYADIEEWVASIHWTGLEIISTEKGREEDQKGKVHFKAHYNQNGKAECIQENSSFRKVGQKWLYVSGVHNSPIMTKNNAVGRNEPCPCGSGKKFKKCCG